MDTRLALCDVRGPLGDLIDKLSGDQGELWLRAFKRFLRRENPWPKTIAPTSVLTLRVWKTIRLGTGLKTESDFRQAIYTNNLSLGDYATEILGKPEFTVAPELIEVELVRLAVKDLGFKESTRHDEICIRAVELGLELCPVEVGPQLRLQYLDQPKNELLIIPVEAVDGLSDDLIWDVEHDGRGCEHLGCRDSSSCIIFDLDDQYVFVSRKPWAA